MKTLDKIFDITLYALTLVCFITVGYLVVTTGLTEGNGIIEMITITVLGVAISYYLMWLKSKSAGGSE